MRKVLLLTGVLMISAATVPAQNGNIGIFADQAGTSCNISSASPLLYVYFVHVNAVGATASQWAAPAPPCMTATHVMDIVPFEVLGNTVTGIAVPYGTCKTGTFCLISALYYVTAAEPCCHWPVVADPYVASGKVEIADCEYNLTYGTGGQAIVNATESCNCNVPFENTTWGQVKAIYVE
jgi:hypothetical protein